MRVYCYLNLNRGQWALRACSGVYRGRVVAYASYIRLGESVCKVSESGRQRVIQRRRKEVHAGIEGELVGFVGRATTKGAEVGLDGWCWPAPEADPAGMPDREITYNPYYTPTFVDRAAQTPVAALTTTVFMPDERVYADPEADAEGAGPLFA